MDQENGKQNNTDGNIWDKVFKTFLQEIPQMVLPLINEAFQEDHAIDENEQVQAMLKHAVERKTEE